MNQGWRVIYQVATALIGVVWLLAFFTFPETAYIRAAGDHSIKNDMQNDVQHDVTKKMSESGSSAADIEASVDVPPPKQSYWQSLKIYNRVLTEESLLRMFVRPLGLILLPPVLWSALVQSVTIGFLVALTSNVASAYQQAYAFEPWQVGLCFISAIVGSLLGIPAGGQLADVTADWFTKRNGGIRVPEMRLPAMMLSLITTPLGLVLFGVGIEKQLHWMCPTIGLGLSKSLDTNDELATLTVYKSTSPSPRGPTSVWCTSSMRTGR